MDKIWSNEREELLKIFSSFAATGLPVSACMHGNRVLRIKLIKLHFNGDHPYLLFQRPVALDHQTKIDTIYFKMDGFPILGFPAFVERESATVLAVPLPGAVFQLELRENARILPLQGSMATFFIKDRARVSICRMENISMGGVKLLGRPTHHIVNGDIIGPCTISMAGRDALIAREVTVNNAKVVRVAGNDGEPDQIGLGLSFDLSVSEDKQLREHVEFISSMRRSY